MHCIAAGDGGDAFTFVALPGLPLLMRGELGLPAHPASLGLGAGAALTGAGTDRLALKLRQTGQDGQPKPPM